MPHSWNLCLYFVAISEPSDNENSPLRMEEEMLEQIRPISVEETRISVPTPSGQVGRVLTEEEAKAALEEKRKIAREAERLRKEQEE